MMRFAIWLCLVLVASPAIAQKGKAFEAIVIVDPAPKRGGKFFRGVWLKPPAGPRLLVAYLSKSSGPGYWAHFAGRKVKVSGQQYIPPGQAIRAKHFRIKRLSLVSPTSRDPWLGFGPQKHLCGTFISRTIPQGHKRAGERETYFIPQGGLRMMVRSLPKHRGEAMIVGRSYRPNMRYAATAGGARFWVERVVRSGNGVCKPRVRY